MAVTSAAVPVQRAKIAELMPGSGGIARVKDLSSSLQQGLRIQTFLFSILVNVYDYGKDLD